MKKIISLVTAFFALISILTGCMGTFKYNVSPDAPMAKQQYNSILAIESFKDERPTIGGSGKMWLAFVPLMPFGWGFYNRPENGKFFVSIQAFKFDPANQLAQAAEMSLKHSGLFKDIYFIQNYTETKPDYIFTGVIKSTLYRQKMFTYCISWFGSLLWFVGAPAGWNENQLEIDFSLKSVKDDRIIWTYTAKNSDTRVGWFYYQGQDVKDYVPVMQRCMNEAILDMNKNLKIK